MTLYFKSEHFKTSIPVAITAMLVMYTLNNSISSKLPQTSSIKFIDIWIIYGLFLLFLIIVLLVSIEHLPQDNKILFVDKEKKNIKSLQLTVKIFAQYFLPVFELAFIVLYFISACCIYFRIVQISKYSVE